MNALVAPGTVQGNWVWDGTQWICGPDGDTFPGCFPPGFPPPGCPPWFPSANSPPWYPGANAGVSFGLTAPANPVRGHFWWDGKILWLFDGAAWANTQGSGSTAADAPKDGNAYGRVNGAWARVVSQAGDTMTGLLMLSGDPAQPLGAVTKQYADAHSGIQRVSPTYYNASGTITIPAGVTRALVQMWGATGGSGGVTGTGASGATGAGGYLEKLITGLVGGNTLIYAQGTAGTAGAATPTAGGNGGITTLASGTQVIPTLTCNGSNGSLAATGSTSSDATVGGTATGGDLNVMGQGGSQPAGAAGLGVGGGVPGGINGPSLGASGTNGAGAGNQGNPGGLKITWYSGGLP